MGGFLSSLFGGQNKTLSSAIGQYGTVAGQELGTGGKDTSQASDFWSGILSGDSSKAMQLLGPTISAAKTSAQQENKKNAEFGTRSGGTAASAATTDDKVHSDITNLTGKLAGDAASNLGSMGTNLLSMGTSTLGQQVGASQQQMANWAKSILGSSITGAVNYGESFLPVAHGGGS